MFNPTFTVIVEKAKKDEVDTDMFISRVPIAEFKSELLVSTFPPANRDGTFQSPNDLKKQISKAGKEGWTMEALLADFHLLLYMSNILGVEPGSGGGGLWVGWELDEC